MSNNQTDQPAMQSRHRRRSSLEAGVPTNIRVNLYEPSQVKGYKGDLYDDWMKFWKRLTTDKRWLSIACYSYFVPTLHTLGKDKQGKEIEQIRVLLSPAPCKDPAAAKRETEAAKDFLSSLGFIDITEPDGEDTITMRWGYPDQTWVKENLRDLEKAGHVKSYPVTMPGDEWIKYCFALRENGGKPSNPKRNSATLMMGIRTVDDINEEEEREEKKAKMEDA